MQLFLRKLTVSISCLLCSVLLSSCLITTDAKLQETKGKYEKEIAAAKESFEQKLEQTQNEINAAKNSVISAQDGQMQAAANSFYGQSLVFKSIIAPTRTDLINKNLMEEGWKALGNRVPDYKTMMEMNERIARELDETKTSLADLQKSHEKVMKENGKLTDATQAALDKVAAKELEMKSLRESYLKEIAALQSKLNEANNAIIAQKNERCG